MTDNLYSDRTQIVFFGNAILDIGKRLESDEFHRKHNLKLDDQLEMQAATLTSIKEELLRFDGSNHISSGGSCLNTCKILTQLSEQRAIFCGGIGSDENGETLKKILDKDSIQRRLQELSSYPTALCICLIHKEYRCLLANIGASTHFNSIGIVEELAALSPGLCYIEGYFIPHKMEICKEIYHRFCVEGPSQLVLNLNAAYIVDHHPEDLLWLFERAHLVFGNRREFDALLRVAKAADIPQLLMESAESFLHSSGIWTSRICVVTDGAEIVQYVRHDKGGNQKEITMGWLAVPKVGLNLVVDTTGAGDAFAAGFLFLYMREGGSGISIEKCIRHGMEVAQRKLAYFGCTIKE